MKIRTCASTRDNDELKGLMCVLPTSITRRGVAPKKCVWYSVPTGRRVRPERNKFPPRSCGEVCLLGRPDAETPRAHNKRPYNFLVDRCRSEIRFEAIATVRGLLHLFFVALISRCVQIRPMFYGPVDALAAKTSSDLDLTTTVGRRDECGDTRAASVLSSRSGVTLSR